MARIHIVQADIDGQTYHNIDVRISGFINNQLAAWLAAGNTPNPYVAPPAPPATCLLWQLQAVMTSAQWSAAQTAIANLNNAAVSAFFSHPGNSIPANSTTLIALGEAIGLSADQIAALVAQGSQVSIP